MALPLLALSCTQTAGPEGYGYMDINVVKDASVVPVDVATRARPADEIALTVYDGAGGYVFGTDDCASVTDPVMMQTGSYTAVATSGAVLDGGAAAFDAPFYSATKEFTVRRNTVETLDMVLVLDAVKVTVGFSQEIYDNFSSYVLTVSNGISSLVFGPDVDGVSTVDRTGYFAVTGTLTYTLQLTAADGRVFEPLTETYTDVKARQHYAFSFSVAERQPEGGAEMVITVDDSMNIKEHHIVLDFTQNDIPRATATFDLDAPLSFDAGDLSPKSVTVDFIESAESLIIRHSDAGLSAAGLPEETELFGATAETVSALAGLGVTAEPVTADMEGTTLDFTEFFASLPGGTYSLQLYARNGSGAELNKEISLTVMTDIQAVSANAWARFAVLSGKWTSDTQPDGLGFQYRPAGGEWKDVEADVTANAEKKTFSAELRGLSAGTACQFRAVSAGQKSAPVQFTTEEEQSVPNMGFDSWSDQYTLTGGWDSANKGSGLMNVYPTVQETSDLAVEGDGKSAARLESKNVIFVGLAAGNLYTGQYIGMSGIGAELDWGVKFTSRPLALKGSYKYMPKNIDQAKDPYTGLKGQPDTCQIQILLTDWDKPFRVNTSSSTFVDFENDPHIIAYGRLEDSRTMESYDDFTVRLEYRNTERKPKYIVIVAAASKYGDYFTGGVGSTLLVDEFSLVYDPDAL